MERNTILILLDNMGSPAFLADEKGNVIFKNRSMRYIRERLGTGELFHIEDMNLEIDEYETEKTSDNVRKFHIRDSVIEGLAYDMSFSDGGSGSIFVFDKSISADKTMTDVMEHIDEIVVIFNKEGTLEKMNSVCDTILPFKRKDVVGKNIKELVEEGLVEDPIILKLIDKKEKVYGDIAYPNGKVISYTAIPIFGSRGNFRGGVLTGRDISRIINLVQDMEHDDKDDIEYISASKSIQDIKEMIDVVAFSEASIFITGESGTGKEVLAKSIWKKSPRRNKPFVAVNCGAIPGELLESELFGYEKGAFTGASEKGKVGLLEAADGGTLFLDEIGELPLEMQKKLLRAMQEGTIMRVGGTKEIKVDVRFISATNKTEAQLRNPEMFRQDLYYRLNVIPINVPALRDRKEDIMPIAEFYIDRFNKKYRKHISLTKEAENILFDYDWPGNIREVKNVIERCVILAAQEKINALQMERMLGLGGIETMQGKQFIKDAVNENTEENSGDIEIIHPNDKIIVRDIMDINEACRICEQEIITKAIAKYGNVTRAAKAVGINPSTIYRKIKNGQIKI